MITKEELEIDKYNLDEEFMKQHMYVDKVGTEHSLKVPELKDMAVALKDLQNDLKTYEASLELSIRRNPENFNVKLTEKSVAALVQSDEERNRIFTSIINHQMDMNKLEGEVLVLDAKMKTLVDRREDLKGLLDLYKTDYYSGNDTLKQIKKSHTKG